MFELLRSDIFLNAWLGGTVAAVIGAVVGYFLVLRAQAFACEAFSDIGFAGATGAALLGVNSIVGMVAFAIVAALGLGCFGEKVRGRDVEIGMVLSFALGIGVLFLSLYAHHSAAHANAGINILFGSLLSVTRQDIALVTRCGIAVLLVMAAIYRPLLFASIDPAIAQARGVPVRLLSMVFLLVLAVTAATAILVSGVLLVVALLVAPAATAVNLAHRPRNAILLAVGFGLAVTWSGLLLAFLGTWRHLPAGFYIATLAAALYYLSLLVRKRSGRRHPDQQPHPNRETDGASPAPL